MIVLLGYSRQPILIKAQNHVYCFPISTGKHKVPSFHLHHGGGWGYLFHFKIGVGEQRLQDRHFVRPANCDQAPLGRFRPAGLISCERGPLDANRVCCLFLRLMFGLPCPDHIDGEYGLALFMISFIFNGLLWRTTESNRHFSTPTFAFCWTYRRIVAASTRRNDASSRTMLRREPICAAPMRTSMRFGFRAICTCTRFE